MKKIFILVTLISLVFLNGCKELRPLLQQMNIQKPKVKVKSVKLSGLSLKDIALDFNLGIENPNNVAITLAGFDYELLIEQHSFLKGKLNKTVKIEARGTSDVHIPVSFTFNQLNESFKTLQNADSIKYTLKTGFLFDVPILGKVRIPAQTTQRIPNVKLPKIKVAGLKLSNLSFNGADLKLALEMDNPNAWSLELKKLNYNFVVNGQKWLQGNLQQALQVGPKQKQRIELPVHLNFLEMGRGVYHLLTNSGALEYHLTGHALLNSSIKLLGNFEIPINQKGKVKLIK